MVNVKDPLTVIIAVVTATATVAVLVPLPVMVAVMPVGVPLDVTVTGMAVPPFKALTVNDVFDVSAADVEPGKI